MLVNRIISANVAGLIAVIVGFTSSVALIYQTVINLGGDVNTASSWVLALGLSMGLTSITLSLYYKTPILIAWSTPGAALLIANSQNFTLEQATAGFIFSACLIFICGITGWFQKIADKLPLQLASSMLAGVLLNFGIGVFNQINIEPTLVIAMFITYLITKYFTPKFTMLFVLIVGAVSSELLGLITRIELTWQFTQLTYTAPEFSINAVMSIGIPLFIVTMAAQNLPGLAVLKAHNYHVPISPILNVTGLVNLLTATFGTYAINLAAITAAICMTDEVSKKPEQRYWAVISAGIFYIVMALSAGVLITTFSALPTAFIYALAGIALLSTITTSIKQSLTNEHKSEAAIITLLVTASDLSLFGISSVLWGLIIGSLVLFLQKKING